MKPVIAWSIYALKHPRTGQICYVGWTSRSINRRLQAHVQQAVTTRRKVRGNAKNRWVLSLLSIGMKPEMVVLESGTGDGWKLAEPKWIAFYRQQNPKLLNRSDGGEGNPGYVFTAEVRKKISDKNKGRKNSPEHQAKWRAAAVAAATGSHWTEERKRAESERLKGIPRPAEFTAAMHAARKGTSMSTESRALLSARRKGMKASAETRAKMSESHKRRPPEVKAVQIAALRSLTIEQRAAMSKKAAKTRWERHGEELRAAYAARMTKNWADPQWRAETTARLKAGMANFRDRKKQEAA